MTPGSPYRARKSWIYPLERISRRRAVILGYHGIAACSRKDDLFMLQLAPARFRAQLEMMRSAGFQFVTVAEFLRRCAGGSPPPGLAAVSFDDAMRNNLITALPILREFGIAATVYVPTGWLGGQSPWIGPGGDGAILSHDEVRELADAGWELGAHTVTHADLSKLDYAACRAEIEGSCEALSEIAGVRPQTLAYPFGSYGPAAIAAARDCGLAGAVTTGSGCWDRYELTRAMVGAADPLPILLLKLTDRYEPLLRSGPMRMVRQASKALRLRVGARRSARSAGPASP